MPFFTWSRTANSNATNDPTINYQEGQSPSSLNDSARAAMAALAMWRDDIAGAIVTAGTSTAYTVRSYSIFDTLAHMNGQMIAFTPHVTNGATVTLNVDSLGAKPLRCSPNVELQSGVLIQGTPYLATYNNSDGAFYLMFGIGSAPGIPLGSGIDHWGSATPSSAFAFGAGQAISRTTYATLFALFGTTYGSGDGSTTFNLPDVRGRVIAGLDNLGGSAAGRLNGYTGNGASGGEQTHTLTTTEMPAHTHANTLTDPGHTHAIQQTGSASNNPIPAAGSTGSEPDATTRSATTGITINNASQGGGGAHNNIQPTIACTYIIRVI